MINSKTDGTLTKGMEPEKKRACGK